MASVTFRPVYRQLSDDEKKVCDDIKDAATALLDHYERLPNSRYKSLAITKLEESVMWMIKGVTA